MKIKSYNLLTPQCRIPVSEVEIRKEKSTDIANVHHVQIDKVWETYLKGVDDYIVETKWDSSINSKLGNIDKGSLAANTWRKWLSKQQLEQKIKNEAFFNTSTFNIDLKESYNYLVYNVPSYEIFSENQFKIGFYSDHNILDYFDTEKIIFK